MHRHRSALLLAALWAAACQPAAGRRGATVLFASGADLQSINPLLTQHPLARQVQRYVLLTTLARYDSAMVPQPYLARAWTWSPDRRGLTFLLHTGVMGGYARIPIWEPTMAEMRDELVGIVVEEIRAVDGTL